jgi:hypothetical protein
MRELRSTGPQRSRARSRSPKRVPSLLRAAGAFRGRGEARAGALRVLGRTRTLDSHASRVRRKIAAFTDTPYVINEWGVGYRLMLPD